MSQLSGTMLPKFLFLIAKSCPTHVTPRTVARQAPLAIGFLRPEYCNECGEGMPFPSPGDLPDPGIKPKSPALQENSLPWCHQGSLLPKWLATNYWRTVQSFSQHSTKVLLPRQLSSKESTCNAGAAKDTDSILGLGRSPGQGNDNTCHCYCLENPVDRGAWWATVHRVSKSQIQLKWLSNKSINIQVRHNSTLTYIPTLNLQSRFKILDTFNYKVWGPRSFIKLHSPIQ